MAEVLNNHQPDCMKLNIPFIQVYTISCNNLANTYCKLGKQKEAEKILKRVFYYLLHLVAKPELNTEEIQSELKRAIIALLHLTDKNGGKEWPKYFTFVCPTEIIEFGWRQNHSGLAQLTIPMLADTSKSLAEEMGILNNEEKVMLSDNYFNISIVHHDYR